MRNWRFRWTEEQEKILLDHIQNKGKDEDLVTNKILPYSLNAIRKKKCRMLCKVNKKEIIKYNPKVKKNFESFLIQNWKNNTPEELANIWNEKNKTKTNRRKVIYYLSRLKIKVSYNQIHQIKTYKKLLENQQYDKARLYKIKMFRNRLERGLDIWTGLKLDPSINTLEDVFIDGKPASKFKDNWLDL